ncbi:class I SAM-dependent methyltransferase [Phormidium yuhuli AB48]|uniref:Class I SAM-dependent methyltransferase n=1 Tax=Phormidium yuhuli AB48 TaxID=2940671 RepID=A0ABY5ANJ1_9CYAN|nr:class I SAM-dependent methyltransferase [Phormidium yuhuli]USR89921.1 class I SAM-dependent methyltransferase [Phormidium yuhuli AB48]
MQKEVFLESEGDRWLSRNKERCTQRSLPQDDPILLQIIDLSLPASSKVLELGCGAGKRLAWMQENLEFCCSGIDPSAEAIKIAEKSSIQAIQGTADDLPFKTAEFDVVIFGFCLYLCDRSDLFKIASEADRVLKDPGWLVIKDFYATTPSKRPYHHRSGIFTYKMDYRTLFSWHPSYTCLTHQVRHHVDQTYTDDSQEWVALSVMRKNSMGSS